MNTRSIATSSGENSRTIPVSASKMDLSLALCSPDVWIEPQSNRSGRGTGEVNEPVPGDPGTRIDAKDSDRTAHRFAALYGFRLTPP